MSTKSIIDYIKENLVEYRYSVYGDGLMEKELLDSELKSLGIINGDDEMVWKSPDNSIYFEVSREYSSTKTGLGTGYQYICTLNVKNNLGIVLDTLKFTELDAIRILDSFVYFNEPDYISDDHNVVYIDISPQDTSMEHRTIVLEQILSGPMTSVLFTLQKYNPFHQQIVPIVKIPMTYEQLNDLAFHLFFAILIDIEIPVELDETMFRIEDYVTTENYWVFQKRRQELAQIVQVHPEKSQYATSFINNNAYYVESFLTDNECYSEPPCQIPMNTVVSNTTPHLGPIRSQSIIPKQKTRNIIIQTNNEKR